MVTVCLGASESQAREALRQAKLDLLTLVDEGSDTVTDFRVRGTPTTYLIGADGTILMSDVGYGPGKEETLRSEVRRLLAEETP